MAGGEVMLRPLGNSERFFALSHPFFAFLPCQNVSFSDAPPRAELVSLFRAALAKEAAKVTALRCVVVAPRSGDQEETDDRNASLGSIWDTGAMDNVDHVVRPCPDALASDWVADIEELAAGRGVVVAGTGSSAHRQPALDISVGDGWINARFHHTLFDGSSIPAVLDRLIRAVCKDIRSSNNGNGGNGGNSTADAADRVADDVSLPVGPSMEALLRDRMGAEVMDNLRPPSPPTGSESLADFLAGRPDDGAVDPTSAAASPMRRTRIATRTVSADTVAAAVKMCRTESTTLHGLLTAALQISVAAVTPVRDSTVFHNVSVRSECGVAPGAPGLFVKGVFTNVALEGCDADGGERNGSTDGNTECSSPWPLAREIKAGIKKCVARKDHLISEDPAGFFAACLAPGSGFNTSKSTRGRLQAMHVSNRGRVPIEGEYEGLGTVTRTHSFSPISWAGPLVSLNVMTSRDGRLHVTIASVVITDKEREAIADRLIEILLAVASTSHKE